MPSKCVYGLHIERGTSAKQNKTLFSCLFGTLMGETQHDKINVLLQEQFLRSKLGHPFPWKAKVKTYFLAGTVFWRFHSLRVWSSETVTNTGSTGWKARARTPSKWLRRVYLGFHVFLNASLLAGS